MTLKCVNGRFEDNSAHDFTDTTAMLVVDEGDTLPDRSSLIFCRRCGEVRLLALAPPDDGPAGDRVTAHSGGKPADPPKEED